ncbi:MAG TPA: hypothetical protein VH857_13645 [Actinomycetes bacterium]|nr:hypothetical protein [Actinomycetes bacterium]
MPVSPRRSGSRLLAALLCLLTALAVLTVGTLTASSAQAKAIKTARGHYPAAIEPLAAYQPQTTCSPTAKPGVANFAARLLAAYPGTRSLGIVRACSVGGRSEHKEGRAFDWGVSASSPSGRAKVARLVHWLFKKDRFGNQYAMARRLGIQYLIWNHHIWGAYAASAGWRKYTGADPHTTHVHISFTWAGARAKTSFWTGKVGAVGAAPVPTLPGSTPHPTVPPTGGGSHGTTTPPRPQPVPAATLPGGPDLADETVSVPGASSGTLTTGQLVAGTRYLIEASGTYRWGTRADQAADAECSTAPGDPTWRRDRSVHPWDPTNDHLDLYVDGTDLQSTPDTDTGDGCDTRTHTYRWTYQPTRTGRVTFALWDPTTLTDNSGALTVRVLAVVPRDDLTWTLPAAAGAGVTSPGALEAGGTYQVTVSGTVDAGGGVASDAACSATTGDPVWRTERSVDPDDPTADDLNVIVNQRYATFAPVSDPDGDGCDGVGHTYRLTLTPRSTAPVNLRIDDPVFADDGGALTVTVSRIRPVVGTETLAVDSAAGPTTTARTYLAGQPLVITATGSYAFAPGVTADAECSATTADPVWRTTRSTLVADGRYLGDLTVDGTLPDWTTSTGSRCDSTTHAYQLSYTPRATGPITLGIADPDLSDEAGTLTVTISPAG